MKRALLIGALLAVGCINFDELERQATSRLDAGADAGVAGGAPGGGSAGGSSGGGSTAGGASGGSIAGGSSGGSTAGGGAGGSVAGGSSGGVTAGGASGGAIAGGTSGGSTAGGGTGGSVAGGSSGGVTAGGTTGGGTTDAGTTGGGVPDAGALPDGGPLRSCDCTSGCAAFCDQRSITSSAATGLTATIRALTETNGQLFAALLDGDGGRFARLSTARDGGVQLENAIPFAGEWRDLDSRFGIALGLSSETVVFHYDGGWSTTQSALGGPPLTGGVYLSAPANGPEAAVYLDERESGVVAYEVGFVSRNLSALGIVTHHAVRARIRPSPGGGGYLFSQFQPADGGPREPWHLYHVSSSSPPGGSTQQYYKQVELASTEGQHTFAGVNSDSEMGFWRLYGGSSLLPAIFDHVITNPVNANLRGVSSFEDPDGGFTDLVVVEQSGAANGGFLIDNHFVSANNEWFVIVFQHQGIRLFKLGAASWVSAALTSGTSAFVAIHCSTATGTLACSSGAGQRFVDLTF